MIAATWARSGPGARKEVSMPFGSLWLPVVVSAVVVWIASAILHMALRYHRADYKPLPDEQGIGAAMRKAGLRPGLYVIPHCADMSQMKDPAVIQRFVDGPVAQIAVMRSGPPAMGKYLVQWFGFCFLVSFVVAYIVRHALLPGMENLTVCRTTGTIAFCAYGMGHIMDSIWKAMPWGNAVRGVVDALIYSVLTGLVFMWLWPGL
jgi:hypothetical protein